MKYMGDKKWLLHVRNLAWWSQSVKKSRTKSFRNAIFGVLSPFGFGPEVQTGVLSGFWISSRYAFGFRLTCWSLELTKWERGESEGLMTGDCLELTGWWYIQGLGRRDPASLGSQDRDGWAPAYRTTCLDLYMMLTLRNQGTESRAANPDYSPRSCQTAS